MARLLLLNVDFIIFLATKIDLENIVSMTVKIYFCSISSLRIFKRVRNERENCHYHTIQFSWSLQL